MKLTYYRCCLKDVRLDDYDYARFCNGEAVYCESCYEDYEKNISTTISF